MAKGKGGRKRNPDWATANEAALVLGVSRATVGRMALQGELGKCITEQHGSRIEIYIHRATITSDRVRQAAADRSRSLGYAPAGYITMRDAANAAGCSVETIRRGIHAGEIAGERFGGRLFVRQLQQQED